MILILNPHLCFPSQRFLHVRIMPVNSDVIAVFFLLLSSFDPSSWRMPALKTTVTTKNKDFEMNSSPWQILLVCAPLHSPYILYLSGTNSWANKINRKINEQPRICALFQNICFYQAVSYVLKPGRIILTTPSNSSAQCLKSLSQWIT